MFKNKELKEILEQLNNMADSYNQLLMAAETKYEGETRHQTALRYIKACEIITDFQGKTAELTKDNQDER